MNSMERKHFEVTAKLRFFLFYFAQLLHVAFSHLWCPCGMKQENGKGRNACFQAAFLIKMEAYFVFS